MNKRKPSTLERVLMAEVERLKARVAELEAELAARPATLKPTVTIDAPSRPVPVGKSRQSVDYKGPAEKKWYRERELRAVVKEAEKKFRDEWRKVRGLSSQEYERGLAAFRAAARADLRTRWAAEDAEGKIELPPHITRL
jgi:hypothetical protein